MEARLQSIVSSPSLPYPLPPVERELEAPEDQSYLEEHEPETDFEDAPGPTALRNKTCGTCGREFKKVSRLNQHLLTHTDSRPFVCPFPGCGKAYKRAEHLKNHSTSHGATLEEKKPYICEYEGCDAAFSNPHHRKRHEKAHVEGGVYKCNVDGCGQAFAKNKQLLNHRAAHAEEGEAVLGHPCPTEGCGKTFPTPSKLAKHLKTHDGVILLLLRGHRWQ